MSTPFARLGTHARIVAALEAAGVTEPFPVQAAAIPDGLAGRDISGKAPTGSGKTLAFGIPLVSRVGRGKPRRPGALVLAPTRELADQIMEALTPIASAMDRTVAVVYGGVGYGHQRSALRRGVDILVATPGRLEDLIEQRDVALGDVTIVVVDEADRMADRGFLPAVTRILDQTRPDRQTLLFSATLDGDVAVLTRKYQNDPVRHEAEAIEQTSGDARHHFWLVGRDDRVAHTHDIIDAGQRTIVFTRTRRGADRLAKQLDTRGARVAAIHGGLSQVKRTRSLKSFSSGKVSALIATDVAARGLHIDAVESVIHFDLPADSKDYLHRSGRTARAGAGGEVFSLVTHDQRRAVQRIQRDLNMQSPIGRPHKMEAKARPPTGHDATEHHAGSRPEGHLPSHGIFVNNLPWSATVEDLREVFADYGKVTAASIAKDRRGRSRGFGFVGMADDEARAAIHGLRGSSLHGRPIKVSAARPNQGSRRG